MTNKKLNKIPENKVKAVSELDSLIKEKKTILIASIKSIPSSQYQEIVKKFRGKAIVKVPKKSVAFRAIDNSGKEAVKKLKEHLKESYALLFSDLDTFDLASELINKKTPAKAKSGQIAEEDLEIQAGPTELVPGPAISELGALGIQIQIEKGKIHIKEPKVIVKKGEKISGAAAEIMSKLDMKPFSIGFIPLAALDTKEGKIYVDIQIDREGTIKELKETFSKAVPFAVEIGYSSEATIKFLIGKAGIFEKTLQTFLDSDAQKLDKESGESKENNVETENLEDEKESGDKAKKPTELKEDSQEVKLNNQKNSKEV